MQCNTRDHEALKTLAYVLVLLWPVGMVGLFVGVLVFKRKELGAGDAHSDLAKAAHFLTSGFKGKFFYWELVELVRRLLVSGWVTLIPYDKMFVRSTFVLLISFVLFGLTALAHPWTQPEDNMLALVSQACWKPPHDTQSHVHKIIRRHSRAGCPRPCRWLLYSHQDCRPPSIHH